MRSECLTHNCMGRVFLSNIALWWSQLSSSVFKCTKPEDRIICLWCKARWNTTLLSFLRWASSCASQQLQWHLSEVCWWEWWNSQSRQHWPRRRPLHCLLHLLMCLYSTKRATYHNCFVICNLNTQNGLNAMCGTKNDCLNNTPSCMKEGTVCHDCMKDADGSSISCLVDCKIDLFHKKSIQTRDMWVSTVLDQCS